MIFTCLICLPDGSRLISVIDEINGVAARLSTEVLYGTGSVIDVQEGWPASSAEEV